ncbi:MAG: inorganic phosphate transporter, partial [Crenarchaeota archaeon]|nr:inorganic phosphate transporter [Thermoproteota archaeon]
MDAWIAIGAAVAAFLAWNNGSNNAANMIGTAVGAKVISLRRALAISALATFVGAMMLGKYVTNTVMRGIINIAALHSPIEVCAAMVSVLVAASIWTLVSSFIKVPMSVHACVLGGLIGAGLAIGAHVVNWGVLARIFISWLFVPFAAAGFALGMHVVIERAVSSRRGLQILVPVASFVAVFVPILLSLLKSVRVAASAVGLAAAAGLGSLAIATVLWRRAAAKHGEDLQRVSEEAMKILLIEAAIAMSFSFGSNDVANSAGPFAAILYSKGAVSGVEATIMAAVAVAGSFLAVGIVSWGSCVVETVGRGITLLCPSSAFVS